MSSTIVVDTGTGFNKVGQSSSLAPDIISELPVKVRPLSNGTVTSWGVLETVWRESIDKVKSSSLNMCKVLISCNPRVTKPSRERMTQILFEKFDVAGMYILNSGVLGLYGSGKTTGINIDLGHSVSSIVPVTEGFPMKDESRVFDFGGEQIDACLQKMIKTSVVNQLRAKHYSVVKEKLCYLKTPSIFENESVKVKKLSLPDGKKITLSARACHECCEGLFYPKKGFGIEDNGLQWHLNETIKEIEKEQRSYFLDQVVLTGGTSLLKGIDERLKGLVNYKMKISASKERKYASWIGGKIVASLSQFDPLWVTKEEYNDFGPTSINRKFF